MLLKAKKVTISWYYFQAKNGPQTPRFLLISGLVIQSDQNSDPSLAEGVEIDNLL